jgi:hypothetical protein
LPFEVVIDSFIMFLSIIMEKLSGPVYKYMEIEGNKMIPRFDHISIGQKAAGDRQLKGYVWVDNQKYNFDNRKGLPVYPPRMDTRYKP